MNGKIFGNMNVLSAKLTFGAAAAVLLLSAPWIASTVRAQTGGLAITSGPGLNEASITDSSATITWRTNEPGSSVVEFGTTKELGQVFRAVDIGPGGEEDVIDTVHSVTLWELKAGTEYYFRVRSAAGPDAAANTAAAVSGVASFTTKPAEPACTEDVWSCGEWSACSEDGVQTRACTLKTDCPTAQTPKPAESQKCEPPKPDKPPLDDRKEEEKEVEAARDNLNQPPPPPDGGQPPQGEEPPPDGGQPPQPPSGNPDDRQKEEELLKEKLREKGNEGGKTSESSADSTDPTAWTGNIRWTDPTLWSDQGHLDRMSGLCRDAGIDLKRCVDWLIAKYGDKSCAEQGFLTKGSCEKYLADNNGGSFPGCEGKSAEECAAVKVLALIEYPTEEAKKAHDDSLVQDIGAGDNGGYWPSVAGGDKETSPAVIMQDADSDGLPDDLEKRLGTDPFKADITDGDHAVDTKVSRAVLKEFFQTGDKPSGSQFKLDIDGDGKVDILTDRYLLGLRTYDPNKQYPAGDTVIFGRTAMILIELNDDRKTLAFISSALFRVYVLRGGQPDGSPPSGLSPLDQALLEGKPLEQPLGSGEVDNSFDIGVDTSGPAGSNPPDQGGAQDGNAAPPPAGTEDVVLSGRCDPDAVCLIYVYSYVPLVLSTTTDAGGNWTYTLNGSELAEGPHIAYVAAVDDEGKIVRKSSPLSLFIKEAQAVTSDDYLRADMNVPTEPAAQYQLYYLIAVAALVILALGGVVFFQKRLMGQRPQQG